MKKLTACLLALLMLAMPLASLADAATYAKDALDAGRRLTTVMDYTVADTITGEAMDQIINDLMEAMQVTVTQQGDEGSFAIALKQEDGTAKEILSIAAATSGKDAYIASNLLNGTIVVNADELLPIAERLADLFVMLGFIEEKDAAQFKAALPELKKMIEAELQNMVVPADIEIDLEQLNLTALTDAITKMMGKMTVSEVTMQPKNCDPAAQVITVTMTPEEMNEFGTAMLQFLKDNVTVFEPLMASFMQGFNAASGNKMMTFEEMIDAAMAELAKEQIFSGDVTYRYWVDAQGQICAMEAVAPMGDENTMTVNYGVLTLNNGKAHSVTAAMGGIDATVNVVVADKNVTVTLDFAEGGVNQMSLRCEVTDRSAENLIACDVVVTMDANMGSDVDYVYDQEKQEWTFVEGEPSYLTIGLNYKQDVVLDGVDFTETDVITISVAGLEILSATGVTTTGDPAESIMAGKVVRPAELSDAEFANWFVGVYNNLASWLMTVITSLPASVTNLMMGM